MNTKDNFGVEELHSNEKNEESKPNEPATEQTPAEETTVTDESPKPEEEIIETAPEATNSPEPDNGAEPEVEAAKVEEDENPIAAETETNENDNSDSEDDEDTADDDDDESGGDDTTEEMLAIEDIVQRLRDLLDSDDLQRNKIDALKNQFYRSLRHETEQQKATFIEGGGEDINFIASEPTLYVEGKELLQKIREKRAEIIKKEDAEKEHNVARKLTIIEQIKVLTENQGQEDFNKTYNEFRSLQKQWNEIKQVPQAKVNELWKSYQHYVEKFYDLVRINNEFREYDFKKNLELKIELCEAAEKLDAETDAVSAFHQLQKLHQDWREIGPVAHKEREAIWSRFKEASASVNKKYQSHFEELREQESENLTLKEALCERLEAIDLDSLKTLKQWNEKVKEVLKIQTQWRQIGYVPRKWNTKIFDRYRAACDKFFGKRNDFYKSLREEMTENLRKKEALCERAEALKDSQDWQQTAQELIAIQKEWKTIGTVPRKYVDSTWKRFIEACDYFFEQKKLHNSSMQGEEANNLELKNAIVEKINNIDTALPADEAHAMLRQLMDEWHQIGFVPFKLKDKAYKDFHDATEAQYDRLNIDKVDRKLETFKTNISDMAKNDDSKSQLLRERERLIRQFERMKGELQTYENNIGFLSVSSQKGNSLIDGMNQRVEKVKAELALIVKKIEAIDSEL